MPDQPSQPLLSPATVDRFLQLQEKELESRNQQLALQLQELEFKKANDKNSFEFGMASLAVQERDNKHARECAKGSSRDRYYFCGFGMVIFAAFLAYAIYAGKSDMAMEIIRAILYLSVGGLGGYSLKAIRLAGERPKTLDKAQS